MILYEYVSFESGNKILEKTAIGFLPPKFFNDPFDLPQYLKEGTDIRASSASIWSSGTNVQSVDLPVGGSTIFVLKHD
jgi:hypothetical protein